MDKGLRASMKTVMAMSALCGIAILCGCEGSSSSNNSENNSRFHGAYKLSFRFTQRGSNESGSAVITIGSDETLRDALSYLYIPVSETSETYSGVLPGGDRYRCTVSVSGQTISWRYRGSGDQGNWTEESSLQFADGLMNGTCIGSGTDADGPWSLSGTFTRM